MAITPRAHELDAVAAILTAEGYETEREMARDAFKAAAQLIQDRQHTGGQAGLFLVTLAGCPVGPFYALADAERWLTTTEARYGLSGGILRLWGPSLYETAEGKEVNAACGCGHVRELHLVTGRKDKPSPPKECGAYRRGHGKCPCPQFSPRKAAA